MKQVSDWESSAMISVIIPTYNRAEFLERAIASAFAQQGVDIEVIVIDDGSTDATDKVLKNLQKTYGESLRIHVQSNLGASVARNVGIDLARGAFVQFLDSDDTLEPEKLRHQLDAFIVDPAATLILCHGWLEQAGSDKKIGLNLGTNPARYIEALCGRTVHVIPTLAPLWRRAYLSAERRWNSELSLGDDLEFHIKCLAYAERIAFVPMALFCIREHSNDRLSDFSVDDDRLSSLMNTRSLIYDILVACGRWTPACAANTMSVLRSIYAVYLQRKSMQDLTGFRTEAKRICGPGWEGTVLPLMAVARQVGGPKAAKLFFNQSARLRNLLRRMAPWRWRIRAKNLHIRICQINLPRARASKEGLRKAKLIQPALNTALYIEPNEFHAEIIPGYISLLSSAGFRTTVIHRPDVPVSDALSRLPTEVRPQLIALTLRDMRRFLRGDYAKCYSLVVIGSGLLVVRGGYYGSFLDFLGMVPNGLSGHIVIEHEAQSLFIRGDKQVSNSQFALRSITACGVHLPMLAPVDFGQATPVTLSPVVKFCVVGRLEEEMRDIEGLFDAVRKIMLTEGPPFEVQLIGGASLSDIPADLRPFFRSLGRLSFREMYTAIDQTHFLLPLLNSQAEMHRTYLRNRTTGTRQLSLGFLKPLVIDRAFANAYGYESDASVIHAPGHLYQGLDQARRLGAITYSKMQDRLSAMKSNTYSESLSNLKAFLKAK